MLFGAVVITTDRACIPEVTQGRANYVSDPYDEAAWIAAMENPVDRVAEMDFKVYDQEKLCRKYYETLCRYLG